MFRKKLTLPECFLIAVNIIPLAGVWFYHWSALHVFLVYCMETVIVGIINVIKMSFVTLFVRSRDVWENNGAASMQSGWLFVFFFIVHYGFFVFVQTQLFFATSGTIQDGDLLVKYSRVPEMLGTDGRLLLLIFVAYYTMQNVVGFFASGKYRTVSLGRLMFEPYMRIFVQQFVVILGGFFLRFGGGTVFILIFVIIKILFELFLNYERILTIADDRMTIKKKQINEE